MSSASPLLSHSPLHSINGVSLLTKTGIPKSRYSRKELLQVLGGSETDLATFLEIFTPRRPFYAVTRTNSDDPRAWTTPRGRQPGQLRRLRDEDVLRHLTGDMLPGRQPRWVAPRAWEATLFVGLDVDFRGNRDDFRDRCRTVERGLRILGVPRVARLISRTPSGGRHYRFFLSRHIRTDDIPHVLALVGLTHVSGQVEIFPSQQRGMRLPFGHLPGEPHRPDRWLDFVRKWMSGEFPRVSWLRCIRRAERYAQRQLDQTVAIFAAQRFVPVSPSPAKLPITTKPECTLGIPKRSRAAPIRQDPAQSSDERYRQLVFDPWTNPSEANELWQMGIRIPGTRVAATKRLAWHLIHVRKLPENIATAQLSRWVYETGTSTSNDVKNDLISGCRTVEQQTGQIIRWCRRQQFGNSDVVRAIFSAEELDSLVNISRMSPPRLQQDRLEFGLRLLEFAKSQGVLSSQGWEFRIAVRGVLRTWPGCSGMRYKPLMDWAIEVGLLALTKEKRQSSDGTGRPRTYLIRIPTRSNSPSTMTFAQAQSHACAALQMTGSEQSVAIRQLDVSDTYENVFLPPRRITGTTFEAVANRSDESVILESSRLIETISTGTKLTEIPNPCPQGTCHVDSDSSTLYGLGQVSSNNSDIEGEQCPEHQYPKSTGGRLAKGTAQRPAIGSPVPGLPDPNAGGVPALYSNQARHRIHRRESLARRDYDLPRTSFSGLSIGDFRDEERRRLSQPISQRLPEPCRHNLPGPLPTNGTAAVPVTASRCQSLMPRNKSSLKPPF